MDGDGHERRLTASISKSMAVMCVRNTILEDIHARIEPVTRTGDFADVVVIDTDGRRLPGPDVSPHWHPRVGRLMRQVVNRLYTFPGEGGRPATRPHDGPGAPRGGRWVEPELDQMILSAIAASRRRAQEGD